MADADSTNGAAGKPADDAGESTDSAATPASMAFVVLLMLAIGAGVFLALWPGSVHPAKDPGFGDNVFASSPVVFAARLILLSAGVVLAVGAVFAIASIAKLWQAGRWLTRFGPFEAAPEAIGTLAEEVAFWRASAMEQDEVAQELRDRLQEANALLDTLLSDDPKDD